MGRAWGGGRGAGLGGVAGAGGRGPGAGGACCAQMAPGARMWRARARSRVWPLEIPAIPRRICARPIELSGGRPGAPDPASPSTGARPAAGRSRASRARIFKFICKFARLFARARVCVAGARLHPAARLGETAPRPRGRANGPAQLFAVCPRRVRAPRQVCAGRAALRRSGAPNYWPRDWARAPAEANLAPGPALGCALAPAGRQAAKPRSQVRAHAHTPGIRRRAGRGQAP